MNATILVAMVAAFALIYFIKTVAAKFILRKAGRAALAEVGRRALRALARRTVALADGFTRLDEPRSRRTAGRASAP